MARRSKAAIPVVLTALAALVVLGIFATPLSKWMRSVNSKQTGAVQSAVTVAASGNVRPAPTAPTGGTAQTAPAVSTGEGRAGLDQLYQQGYQYYNEELYQKAINLENRVIQEDPAYYPAYTIKGIALCYYGYFDGGSMKDKDFDEGMQDIDDALVLQPDYSSALFNKALAYELYGQYDTALYWYDRTIAIEPNSVWSYYGKAAIYGRRGDVANTVMYLKQAIALNPAAKKDARGEKDFDNVRNSPEFQSLVSE